MVMVRSVRLHDRTSKIGMHESVCLWVQDWRQSIHPFGPDETRPGHCRDMDDSSQTRDGGNPTFTPG